MALRSAKTMCALYNPCHPLGTSDYIIIMLGTVKESTHTYGSTSDPSNHRTSRDTVLVIIGSEKSLALIRRC